jgi:uncharacterized iron-regulated membrane protein
MRSRNHPPSTPSTLPPDAPRLSLDRIVDAAKARRPGDVVRFAVADDDRPAWLVSMSMTPDAEDTSAVFMFDARTGAFLHDFTAGRGAIMATITRLHVDLFAGLPGTLFLGGMGLLFLASIISGVVVYGPFMRRLPFGVVRRGGSRRLTWLDLHNLLGIAIATWAFVVGATGVINTWARPIFSHWQSTELAQMVAPWQGKPAPAAFSSPQRAIETAQAAAPELEVSFVAFPGAPFAGDHHYTVFMRGDTPLTSMLMKPLLIDAQSGELADSRDMPWYVSALRLSQPLHFGDYGGLPLKIAWALLDVLGIIVLVSGMYLWLSRGQAPLEARLEEIGGQEALSSEATP